MFGMQARVFMALEAAPARESKNAMQMVAMKNIADIRPLAVSTFRLVGFGLMVSGYPEAAWVGS